jgi:hypothetical protein
MRKVLLALLPILLFATCKKDNSPVVVHGLYTENSPVSGRSQLKFINGSLVIKSETGSAFADTFKYTIKQKSILLTPAWTTLYPAQEFDFEKIDENSIKIENLYPGIPENPKSHMLYKK